MPVVHAVCEPADSLSFSGGSATLQISDQGAHMGLADGRLGASGGERARRCLGRVRCVTPAEGLVRLAGP